MKVEHELITHILYPLSEFGYVIQILAYSFSLMLRGGFGRLNEKPYTNSIPTLFLEKVKGSNRLSNCISIYSSCRLVRGEQRNISPQKTLLGMPQQNLESQQNS